ncbi:S-adenosyl-L-methionine-dependent methyltransferase [Sistotremastrum suecicum HHB10207 ss-3]|uniref:rRNA adenine N(6)-methyltransferase n=1 Tax=Sistotremastrum suecicum HHB10207 ss-3 TaxID=1314776 RepID=A0A166IDP4_9AGAM|nr:S-adenosyl-L-methionine-dependent methyltransferase [Sistotremastrum suecicum HHB10207 ss-3]
MLRTLAHRVSLLKTCRPHHIRCIGFKLHSEPLDIKAELELPPESEWRTAFPPASRDMKSRVFLQNPKTAAALASAFLGVSPRLTLFSGPGVLTRALLQYPPSVIRKLIVLEDVPGYLRYLKGLEGVDSRVVVVPKSGYEWSTYRDIEKMGLLDDVEQLPWESGVHPDLRFVSHLQQSIHGEQLIAQLLRYISERSWLYKYGRVEMNILLGDWVWHRISAAIGTSTRCKLGVVAEANSHFKLAAPAERLTPYTSHFFPPPSSLQVGRAGNRRAGHPLVAASFVPKADPVITAATLDKWDFVLRGLFVLKGTSLRKALPTLAAGASNLIGPLTDPDKPEMRVDVEKKINALTLEDWSRLLTVFDAWPFAPDMLFISDSLTAKDVRD